MGVVIVGGGHAGIQTADSLRSGGYSGSITIVEGEEGLPYQRPPLSKDYLAPTGKPAPLPLRPASFFTEKGIDLRSGVTATDIHRDARTLSLSDGTMLPYEHLVLATGARSRELGCAGANLVGVHGLKTLEDAQALNSALTTARSVLVVGAGFIGLEFAAAARARGCSVTVLEFAPRPMGRALTPATAEWFAAAHQELDIQLRLDEGIDHFEADQDDRVSAAVSTAGKSYPADLVVVGVGVTPSHGLASRAGLEISNGILVDGTLRTSDPAILAIGDCANFPNIQSGSRTRLESVQNATAHGRHAAQTILGSPSDYAEIPWFWSIQGPWRLQIAGIANADDMTMIIGDPGTASFSVLCYRNGLLVAVESVNAPADHMASRKLLATGRGPSPDEAATPGFGLKTHLQQTLPTPVTEEATATH